MPTSPAKMYLANLSSGEQLTAQHNPESLRERLGAVYTRHGVVGLSHRRKQFYYTDDLTIPIELFFLARNQATFDGLEEARRFIHALHYPVESFGVAASPPRVLFVWPGIYSLTCVVTEGTEIGMPTFNHDLGATQMLVRMTLEEVRDVQLLSGQVALRGTQRSP